MIESQPACWTSMVHTYHRWRRKRAITRKDLSNWSVKSRFLWKKTNEDILRWTPDRVLTSSKRCTSASILSVKLVEPAMAASWSAGLEVDMWKRKAASGNAVSRHLLLRSLSTTTATSQVRNKQVLTFASASLNHKPQIKTHLPSLFERELYA